jgi:genome maintenance exonuclease 1
MKKFKHDFVQAPVLNRVTNEETGKRHYALEDGTVFPSVTTVLSELPSKGLDAWRKRLGEKEANKKSQHGSNRGTALHAALEQYVRNETPTITHPVVRSLYNQVRATFNAFDNARLIETGLYSRRLFMAGTPDYIGDWNGILSVVDLKTSTKPKQEKYIWSYYCQVAAYAVMYEELFGVRPEQGVIVVAVEESPTPQLFKKPIDECFPMLVEYVQKLQEYRKTLTG